MARWRLLDDDIEQVRAEVTDLLAGVAGSAVIVAFMLGAVAIICWPLALAVVIVLVLARRPARAATRRSVTRRRERAVAVADLEHVTAERFAPAGAVLTTLYGDPDRDAEAFDVRAAQLRDLGVRVALGDSAVTMVQPLLTAASAAVVYGAGGLLVVGGHVGLGGLVAIAACLPRLHRAVAAVASAPADTDSLLTAGAHVLAVLDEELPVPERDGAVGLWRGPTVVAFEHVDLVRPPGPVILRDVTFRIEPGELVAVVGPADTGPADICPAILGALVPRLLDVTAGAVRLGGVDVRDATVESLRAKVGFVPAEPHLLRDTLGVNLRIARPVADDAELLDALALVELADLVPALPQGLDTVLAPSDAEPGRGHRLGVGERRRLALARIVLQAPDVVVVDEGTTLLDAASERAGQRALAAAVNGRTALVLAHRLSTVRRADRIVVVSGGQVVEQGTHLELLANDRAYTQLYHLELADPEDAAVRQTVLS
jgi:ABC-type multidrug transport system fused ATPase/permease subunit